MTYRPITTFEDVILFELQKILQANGDRRLSFSQIWRACEAAALSLPDCPPPDLKRKFASRILMAVNNLDGGWITKHTKGSEPFMKITHITATSFGIEKLKQTIFTNQEVLRSC